MANTNQINVCAKSIKKSSKEIIDFVLQNTKSYFGRDVGLAEIIILPDIPFYIIARFNVKNIESVCDNKLNLLFEESKYLLKNGIFCVFRPQNFKISNQSVNKSILGKAGKFKDAKIKKSFFDFGKISECAKSIIFSKRHFKKEIIVWEMEIEKKESVLFRIFTDEPVKDFKYKNIRFEFISKKDNLRTAKKLVSLANYCAGRKKNLMNLLFCK